MARLYKKPVIVTDPKTGEKIKTKSKKWWGRYRDENGVERRVPLAVDKGAAQIMLNEAVASLVPESVDDFPAAVSSGPAAAFGLRYATLTQLPLGVR